MIGKGLLMVVGLLMSSNVIAEEVSMSSDLAADKFLCKSQGLERRVEIDYIDEVAKVPCQVKYFKDSEKPGTEPEVLWTAERETGYCEQKTVNFVEKLRGFGWDCNSNTTAGVAH